jgi:hypothetical protein
MGCETPRMARVVAYRPPAFPVLPVLGRPAWPWSEATALPQMRVRRHGSRAHFRCQHPPLTRPGRPHRPGLSKRKKGAIAEHKIPNWLFGEWGQVWMWLYRYRTYEENEKGTGLEFSGVPLCIMRVALSLLTECDDTGSNGLPGPLTMTSRSEYLGGIVSVSGVLITSRHMEGRRLVIDCVEVGGVESVIREQARSLFAGDEQPVFFKQVAEERWELSWT